VTHPAFYNDDVITDALVKHYGVAPADAVNYIHSTCAEISIIGKSKAHSTPFVIDLPKCLVQLTQEKSFADFEDLYAQYIEALKEDVEKRAREYAVRVLEGARIGNEAMRICALIDDCIERGRGIYEGGERYMFEQPIFIGFATAVDSLIAISELVYVKKELSLAELSRIVKEDFQGNEQLRQRILRMLPHYGNDDPVADRMASRVAASLQQMFEKRAVLWDRMMPGTFSYINHATHGAKLGATFDGRRAGTAYSDGCGPVQGMDVKGPTAMICSLTSWDQSALLGGMVVNLKLAKRAFDAERRRSLLALVRTFMEKGGLELQINVVDRATLEDAAVHPERHGDLIVRIGGYSDYFTRLGPVLQGEIIARTEC
jgi:formate C-acetyltransferase